MALFSVRVCAVNVVVQQARIDLIEGQQPSIGDLEAAHKDALDLRARLLDLNRFEEAGRLLMLAADAAGMLEPFLRADDRAATLGCSEVLPDLVGADEVHERALEWNGARRGRVHDDLE